MVDTTQVFFSRVNLSHVLYLDKETYIFGKKQLLSFKR